MSALVHSFDATHLDVVEDALLNSVLQVLDKRRHGHLQKWQELIDHLPDIVPDFVDFNSESVVIGSVSQLDDATRKSLRNALLELHPWRKGPFNVFGISIDSEWRSNLKWHRLENRIQPLKGRRVLDVGCGNGYYIYRMLGAQVDHVLGIDPSQLFTMQFNTLKHFTPQVRASVLPLRCEELPFSDFHRHQIYFDTIFSMGILYHRKTPENHLNELKRCLRPGGELVLETLIIDSPHDEALTPDKTYAKMPNVWSIPSESALINMLDRVGFEDINTLDISSTDCHEQRQTEWMTYESLSDFLHPEDSRLTIEGYPGPRRIIVTCTH